MDAAEESETREGNRRWQGSQRADIPVDPDVPKLPPTAARRRAGHVLRDRWDILLVISAGGALGSLGRWAVGALLPRSGGGFPVATFIENFSGAFVLGVLMVFVFDVWPPSRYLRPFLGVGLLGGYTTFSSYMLETRDLLVSDRAATAVLYLAGSLLAGLLAVLLSLALARLTVRQAQRRRQCRSRSNLPTRGTARNKARSRP